ncbi:alkaline phosphatase, tissue-nonspecific isozyme-like isoform X2 [Ciona intestinalis]
MHVLIGVVILSVLSIGNSYQKIEERPEFWTNLGKLGIEDSIKKFKKLNFQKAKNIILFIGDGMNLGTITAGRISIGQKTKGKDGEEHVTSIDKLPYTGIVKTYSVDHQTPDSASTATAILTGVKTKSHRIGVNAKADDCVTSLNNKLTNVLELANEQGKSLGIVTTTSLQHATPAAAYAHVPNRGWYSDRRMKYRDRATNCIDISLQLLKKRRDIQVLLGGGRSYMRSMDARDEEGYRGDRKDGRDLIQEWKEDMERRGGKYVWNISSFNDINPSSTNYLLGMFNARHMIYSVRRKNEPTLAQMTAKAIQILSKNRKGYILLVEAGLIDVAHHQGRARFAVEEFHELERAVEVAKTATSEENTLLIVTADHGQMFMFGSGSVRGNPVYGLAPDNDNPGEAADGKRYTSLLYGTGPGNAAVQKSLSRQEVSTRVSRWKNYVVQSAVPMRGATHSAEDVVVFGRGPMAHMISGVHEQSYIGHVMMYAACLGPQYQHFSHCKKKGTTKR